MSWKDLESREVDPRYGEWRHKVLTRDGHKCQLCNKKKKRLEVHHIETWAKNEYLRFEERNGITLCKSCHYLVTRNEDAYRRAFHTIIKYKYA